MSEVKENPKAKSKSPVKDKLPKGVSKRLEVLFGLIEAGCQDVHGSQEKEQEEQKKGADAKQEIRGLLIQAYSWLGQYEDDSAWPGDEKLARKIIEAIGEERVSLRTAVSFPDEKSGVFTIRVEGTIPFWSIPESNTMTNTVEVGKVQFRNLAGIRSDLMLKRLMRLSQKPI